MNTKIDKKINEFGLRLESKFIPFSQSRNKNEKYPSLNWIVTLYQKDKKILSTDYGAGSGHCPSYNKGYGAYEKQRMIKMECERGFEVVYMNALDYVQENKKKPILPDIKDVLYSLLLDSDALDYEFPDWCVNFGYEEDSRKAEKIYNECVELGLQMLRVLGQTQIQELREVYQDY